MAETHRGRRNVVTLVRRRHDDIRRLFDETQTAAPDRRPAVFGRLVRLLAVHETAEEMVVYPTLMTAGSAARSVVQRRKTEEDQAKKALANLEGMNVRSADFLALLQDFHVEVEAHAQAEESEILPLLEQYRSSYELRAMEVAFKAAEGIAPTHAHRFAPESLTGNLLLGPAVSIFDRLRDMVTTGLR